MIDPEDGEFLDLPVTRPMKVCPVGMLDWEHCWMTPRLANETGVTLSVGTRFVLRPHVEASFRGGVGVITSRGIDLSTIPSACNGDIVYRVDPGVGSWS